MKNSRLPRIKSIRNLRNRIKRGKMPKNVISMEPGSRFKTYSSLWLAVEGLGR